MTGKKELRAYILEKRNALTSKDVFIKSRGVIDSIHNIIIEKGSMILLGYMPLGNEIDLAPLFHKILNGEYKINYGIDITLGLPRVMGGEMKFFEVKSMETLVRSGFGIMEPEPCCGEIVAEGANVLVPLVGLNKDKKRLGFGGGYYDRYFNAHPDNTLYGIAYDFQLDLNFIAEEHDIAMNYVLFQ